MSHNASKVSIIEELAWNETGASANVLAVESQHELEALLRSAGVPLHEYGKGGAKRLEDLFNEITSTRRSRLERVDGQLVRVTRVCEITLVSNQGILVETHKRLATGSLRAQNALLATGLRPGELVLQAVRRAAKSKLGVEGVDVLYTKTETEEHSTVSYPGLLTRYRKALVCAKLAAGSELGNGNLQFTTQHEGSKEESYWMWLSAATCEEIGMNVSVATDALQW